MMEEEEKKCETLFHKNKNKVNHNHMSGGVYGVAFIGAAIYFIQTATTFWMGVLGVLKAMVWPAFLIYKIMEYLKM